MTSSTTLFQRATGVIPGGVNSPARTFDAVDGTPFFAARASGAHLHDVDGNRYIDYVGSWGPMIVGHNHPAVRAAVIEAVECGLSFGTPCEIEVRMAETVAELVPSVEMLRMVNSGTEATMSAVRLARGATGRDRIVKFEGCYHGHADSFLVKAGSGLLTLGEPNSPGVPKALADLTLTLPFNDLEAARQLFEAEGDSIAALIVEPVAGNMNCIPPVPGFLEGLRELCSRHGSVLIFDEVMTGFRVALGGAQAHFGITPDLTTFGKIIGGGMPVGAVGGRRELMQQFAPTGPVYQAGTLSGNPITLAAGLAMLELIREPGFHDQLSGRVARLTDGLQALADEAGVPFSTQRAGGMFGLFFAAGPVNSLADSSACNDVHFRRFHRAMLDQGVYFAPSRYETAFMSSAHDGPVIEQTLDAARQAFEQFSR